MPFLSAPMRFGIPVLVLDDYDTIQDINSEKSLKRKQLQFKSASLIAGYLSSCLTVAPGILLLVGDEKQRDNIQAETQY